MIEKALRQLEVGELSLCKFGQSVKFLHDFSTHSDEQLGPRLLQELNFEQNKTDLVNLLNITRERFSKARQDARSQNQMLIIIGDGRGVLADSLERVKEAIQRLFDEQVTVFFIVVDNGEQSIVETNVAVFPQPGKVEFIPYMSKFPFPFYAIVRHINVLPTTIAEAIRQWFELTMRD